MPEFKVLIDTNVFIGLEDPGQIAPKFADLVRKCGEHGVRLFVHEDATRDIERDRDASRRDASLSRVRKFNLLSGIPKPDRRTLEQQYGRIAKDNDEVDVALLHAINIRAVDFLVTQDQGVHARVKALPLSKQVLTVDDALLWLRQTFQSTERLRSPDQEVLIQVLEYFGFQHTLTLPNGEFVYEKPLSRQRLLADEAADLFAACRTSYPRFVARPPANVFCVPIQNEYHQKLFPELAIPSPLPSLAMNLISSCPRAGV